jgi:tyrosinase
MATVRKNAYKLTGDEQLAFVGAVSDMIKDGSYGKLVEDHMDMRHRMHSMPMPFDPGGVFGMWRFLSWHRAYLMEFETKLQKKNGKAFVPYWNWIEGGMPLWVGGSAEAEKIVESVADFVPFVGPAIKAVKPFGGFRPTVKVKGKELKNTRNDTPIASSGDPWPPVKKDIDDLLAITEYAKFTQSLESYPHNTGHRVLGGEMLNLTSPSDPIFWMHHAQVDRVWASWQKKNPGKGPVFLTDKNAKMDPWEGKWNVTNLSDISKLGYSYDSLP